MGLSPTVAGDRAGDAHTERAANELMLAQSETVQEKLIRHGLGHDVLLGKLKSKLSAKETKFFADKGIVTDSRNVVAHDIQLRALQIALRVAGLDVSGRGITVNAGNVGLLFPDGNAPAWMRPPQLPNGTPDSSTLNGTNVNSSAITVTSTIEGTGKRTGGLGHDRRNTRWQAKTVPNSKRAKALRKSNGRHGAAGNLKNGNMSVPKKSVPAPKRKRSSKRP